MSREELLKAERQLKTDIETTKRMLFRLCKEGGYPKMSIPLQEGDEDRACMRVLESAESLAADNERLRKALEEAVEVTGLYCAPGVAPYDEVFGGLTWNEPPRETNDSGIAPGKELYAYLCTRDNKEAP